MSAWPLYSATVATILQVPRACSKGLAPHGSSDGAACMPAQCPAGSWGLLQRTMPLHRACFRSECSCMSSSADLSLVRAHKTACQARASYRFSGIGFTAGGGAQHKQQVVRLCADALVGRAGRQRRLAQEQVQHQQVHARRQARQRPRQEGRQLGRLQG